MEFFKSLAPYLTSADLNIQVRGGENQMTVSILPKSTSKEVTAKIKPLLLNGTPDEIDRGFFEAVAKPLAEATGLLKNASEFEAQVASQKKTLSDKKEKDKGGKKPEPAKGKTTTAKAGKGATVTKVKEAPVAAEAIPPAEVTPAAAAEVKVEEAKSQIQQTTMFPEA